MHTPLQKGVRTALQAAGAALLSLVVAVWAVPGVPEVVQAWLQHNAIMVMWSVGLPAGVIAWIQNRSGH